MGCTFNKCRPKFLQVLEYDGYNEELKLAFEYQGIQHYQYIPHFHRNGKEDFEKQKERDALKDILSIENNITVIRIPYEYDCYDEEKLKGYIKNELIRTKNIFIL